MARIVEFVSGAGARIWIDLSQVVAITPTADGDARLWVGCGEFFEVAASPQHVAAVVADGQPIARVSANDGQDG